MSSAERRRSLKPYGYIAAFAAALGLLFSCAAYRAVSFELKLTPARHALLRDRAPVEDGRPERTWNKMSAVRITTVRHLALMGPSSPVASINDRGVGLAEQGRYGEAEILFREVLAEDPGANAAFNNLGVICELAGRRDEAFRHYSTACLGEPNNTVFRNNFRSFTDSSTGRN
jgi:tetratricopeptide (TPR) repeat protein